MIPLTASINKVILLGTLSAKGVEVRFLDSGTAVASFALELPEQGQHGQTYKQLVFCEGYGKKAEAASEIAPGPSVPSRASSSGRSAANTGRRPLWGLIWWRWHRGPWRRQQGGTEPCPASSRFATAAGAAGGPNAGAIVPGKSSCRTATPGQLQGLHRPNARGAMPMSTAFAHDYDQHLADLLLPLVKEGVPLYRLTPAPAQDLADVWVPLRPACRLWRVPHATQQWIEQQLQQPRDDDRPPDWCLHWDGRHTHLLVSMLCVQAHIVPHGEHPACHAFTHWQAKVMVALMHHGTYDPARNHEPHPGEEIDALERKLDLQAKFDECFPWFKSLKRYRILTDEDGHKYAEEIPTDAAEEDEDV